MTQTSTQNDKKTAAPPVNGSTGVAHDTDDEAKATRTPRQVFIVVTKESNSGEIFVFKSIKEAETFLNTDARAPKTGGFEVILGHLQETKQRVSLR